jgi:diacylglycerol kinase family enzyme
MVVAVSRFARRAALRAATSAMAAVVIALPARRRDGNGLVAATVAGAIVAGAAQELPAAAGPAVAVAAAGLARARPQPATVAGGLALGAGVALALRRVWPVPPRTAAEVRRSRARVPAPAVADGAGTTIVVNDAAGRPGLPDVAGRLRDRLPRAELLELDEGGDLAGALHRAARADVMGVAGGDGTINAGAGVARRTGRPLVVVPAGTLNHFTRDLGVEGPDDAADALRSGSAVAVDTGTIDGRAFLNTASFGAYVDLVDAREQLEDRIGKWPALVVAAVRIVRSASPVDVELDGRRRRLWMVFVGNCAYSPPGFAPGWRERLDDGWLDVRLVDASRAFAPWRLLAAILTGRLARTAAYEAYRTRALHVRCLDGPLRLARDGETFDGSAEFTVVKGEPLVVYAPSA